MLRVSDGLCGRGPGALTAPVAPEASAEANDARHSEARTVRARVAFIFEANSARRHIDSARATVAMTRR